MQFYLSIWMYHTLYGVLAQIVLCLLNLLKSNACETRQWHIQVTYSPRNVLASIPVTECNRPSYAVGLGNALYCYIWFGFWVSIPIPVCEWVGELVNGWVNGCVGAWVGKPKAAHRGHSPCPHRTDPHPPPTRHKPPAPRDRQGPQPPEYPAP